MAGHELPPEVWLCIFQHVTYVPGTLVPEIYGHASLIGPIYARTCNAALRETLVTTRALVRVCKQWWHLASPYLYRSVYIGRARCLSSLSSTMTRSAAGKGTIAGSTRPLGEYTQRLDIAIRDHPENASAECDSLSAIIMCMPHLSILSFSITSNFLVENLPNRVLDALHHSAASLRVLDWSSTQLEPSLSRMVTFIAECTQLRVLNCPRLFWSRELKRGGIPPTVTTCRLHALFPVQIATIYNRLLPDFDPSTVAGPTALQELILDLNQDLCHWKDLLSVYSDQLVSIQFYIPNFISFDIDGHMQLLTRTCPRLRRLTIASEHFSTFIGPRFVFPPIVYLGLRASRSQSPRSDFQMLFEFLEELRSSVPSLQVVQLLNEKNVQCLLKTHTKLAVRSLKPFMVGTSFRVEDSKGVLLTGSRRFLWAALKLTCLAAWLDKLKILG